MLLVPPEGYVHNAELLKEIIHQRATNVYERSNRHQFVDPHRVPEYFWEKCFPILFPYGRGGPSDPSLITLKFKDFVASVLQRGGCSQGRRFQNCAPFVFAAYTIEMRRKIGGVASRASECKPQCEEDSTETGDVTVEDMTKLIDHLKENRHYDPGATATPAIKMLLSRLTPFSESLKGSPMYMAYERKKLLAMIQSPVVDKFGDWRYFVTFAPAESYDQRLFDVASNYTMMNAPYGEDERYLLGIPTMEKSERNDVLAKHPALSARLFDLKQHALWECVLQGKHQPMGEVVDFWRRAEVRHTRTQIHFSLSLSLSLSLSVCMCACVCV